MAWQFFKPGQDEIVIDKTVKNPWNWQWLSRNINNGKKDQSTIERLPNLALQHACYAMRINEEKRGWKSVNNIFFKNKFSHLVTHF